MGMVHRALFAIPRLFDKDAGEVRRLLEVLRTDQRRALGNGAGPCIGTPWFVSCGGYFTNKASSSPCLLRNF